MIISNSRNYIFCHIPKTAGESVTAALDPTLEWNDIVLGGTGYGRSIEPPFRKRYGLWKHSTASEIRTVVGPGRWAESVTFAIVRHPFDRLFSLYGYLDKMARRQPWKLQLKRHLGRYDAAPWSWPEMQIFLKSPSFEQFVRCKAIYKSTLGQPQARFVTLDGKPIIKRIIRFESLHSDLVRLFDELGLAEVALPHVNRSSSAVNKADLSAEARSILEREYSEDLQLFGYSSADSSV